MHLQPSGGRYVLLDRLLQFPAIEYANSAAAPCYEAFLPELSARGDLDSPLESDRTTNCQHPRKPTSRKSASLG
jgi:hypothetical protein